MAINHRFIGSVALSLVDLSATTGTFSGALVADSAAITNAITGASLTTTGDVTCDNVIATTDVGCATVTATGVVSTGGVKVGSNDTDGVEWVGSVNTAKFYSDGTNLIMAKGGTAWITFQMGSTPTVAVGSGMNYGYYGPVAGTSTPATTHGGQWTTTAGKASTTDWEHNVDVVTNGANEGEMARVWKTGSTKNVGISVDGGHCVWVTNKSGGALAYGDPLVCDVTTALSVTSTTTGADTSAIGVCVTSAPANNAGCWVAVHGVAKLHYIDDDGGGSAGVPALGDLMECSAVAGKARVVGTPTVGATLGRVVSAGDESITTGEGYCLILVGVR